MVPEGLSGRRADGFVLRLACSTVPAGAAAAGAGADASGGAAGAPRRVPSRVQKRASGPYSVPHVGHFISAAHLVSTVLFCSIHGRVGAREQVVRRSYIGRGKGGDANADSQTENAVSDREFVGLDPH